MSSSPNGRRGVHESYGGRDTFQPEDAIEGTRISAGSVPKQYSIRHDSIPTTPAPITCVALGSRQTRMAGSPAIGLDGFGREYAKRAWARSVRGVVV
jgi:hypothetical protein